jgi:HlyD family secretion protein
MKKVNPWVVVATVATCFSVGVSYYAFSQAQTQTPPTPIPSDRSFESTAVVALGRLEPKGEIIKLSVPNAQDSRVNQLLVQEGDRVQAGQIIAILQGLDKRQADLTAAEDNVAINRAKLAQIQAGDAKVAELAAQQTNIARLQAQLDTEIAEKEADIVRVEAELRNAAIDYQRHQALYEQGAVSISALDGKRERWETTQAQLDIVKAQRDNIVLTLQKQIQQEQAMLAKLSEVRPVDVQVAQAELNAALTQVNKAKADLEDLYVRVPVAGQILKINTRVGEQVNINQGIVELGQTDQMYVIAEVYETDISKIKVGQRAITISENGGFDGEIHGSVDHIGLQIKKKNVLESDPAADKDARVVEVKIQLDPADSHKVAGFTNMQVRIRIALLATEK